MLNSHKIILLIVTLCCVTAVWADKGARIVAKELTYDFGTIAETNGLASHVFTIQNTGDAPLVITRVTASCGCTRPEWSKAPIAPGQTGEIKVSYDPKGRPGPFYKTVSIYSNGKKGSYNLAIKGSVTPKPVKPVFVYPYAIGPLKLHTKQVLFSSIRQDETLGEKIHVKNEGDGPVRIELGKVPHYLLVQASPETLASGEEGAITLLLDAKAIKRKGRMTTEIPVTLSVPGKKEEVEGEIHVAANVIDNFSKLSASEKAQAPVAQLSGTLLEFGQLPDKQRGIPLIGGKVIGTFEITNTGKTPLLIYSVTCDDERIDISGGKKELKPGTTALYKVAIHPKTVKTKLETLINVVCNDPNGPIRLIKVTAYKEAISMEHPENDDLYKGLKVNKGIADVPTVNPYMKKRVQRKSYTPAEYVEGILKGNITVLSQAVTLVESAKHEHQQVAQEIIEKCLPFAGKSMRIGITGVPGAGKSTSIDVFGMHLLEKGHKLAVLAIDPSSERSKGSILGDKTRMEALSREKNAFIRPSPSAGSLGGVARKTRETIVLCEAAGFDTVFVETVGVGQSETAVHSMVDFFLLIQLAGTGDELQGIKRGIMEMADGIIINKADGDNIDKAKLAATQFRNALHLFPPSESGWFPKVLTYSGYYNLGIKEIWDMVEEYMQFTKKNGYFDYKRNEQAKYWMYESINDTLRDKFYNNPAVAARLATAEQQVLRNELSSFVAAKQMIDLFLANIGATEA